MNDPNLKYAIPAAIFFALLAFLLFWQGSHVIQSMVLIALFCGALGQFLTQDNGVVQRVVAMAVTLLAILLAASSTITFIVA